jgi:hypothetical protein
MYTIYKPENVSNDDDTPPKTNKESKYFDGSERSRNEFGKQDWMITLQ